MLREFLESAVERSAEAAARAGKIFFPRLPNSDCKAAWDMVRYSENIRREVETGGPGSCLRRPFSPGNRRRIKKGSFYGTTDPQYDRGFHPADLHLCPAADGGQCVPTAQYTVVDTAVVGPVVGVGALALPGRGGQPQLGVLGIIRA